MQSSLSTVVRKPWKGQLDPALTAVKDRPRFDAVDWVGLGLRKFAELSLLTALIAVPLVYALQLSENRLLRISDFFAVSDRSVNFFNNEILTYLYSMLPTLETKVAAWGICGIALFCGYFAAKLAEGFFRRRFFHQEDENEKIFRRARHRVVPLILFGAFILYGLASIFFWPPPLAIEALGADGSSDSALPASSMFPALPGFLHGWIDSFLSRFGGGGGFLNAVMTFAQIMLAFLFFLIVEDMLRERRLVNKILGVIVFVGVLNALVVVLLKIEFSPLLKIWPTFADSEYRNNFGAFIGHNTGVSSFLIAPFLISIVWLFGVQPQKRTEFRILLGGCTLLMAMALIIAQSRAIVPILVIIVPIMIFVMARRACLVYSSRFFIWLPVGLFFVLATQLIPSKHNPFYREDITLAGRVMEFRPARLLTETRLRILVVSATQLIPERPIHGHSLGSFHYVYPPAQGEYFENNPRSRLSPLALRTAQAHNEYLQILIELGIIGLGLSITGLVFLLRGGWRTMSRSLMPYHVSTQIGVFFSIIGILLHGLVDFPFRVPPIALILVVLLAIWSAGDRLWLFPLREPRSEDDEVAPPTPTPTARRRTFRSASLARSAALTITFFSLIILFAGSWLIAKITIPFLSANNLVYRSSMRLDAYMSDPSDFGLLLGSEGDLIVARRIYWIYGPTNARMAVVNQQRANHFYREADRMLEQGDLEGAHQMRAFATSVAKMSLTDMQMTFTEENHHRLYQINSYTYDRIARNSVGIEREEYFQLAQEYLTRAVNMNYGDYNAVVDLIRLLRSLQPQPIAETNFYLGILHHFHPFHFVHEIIAPLDQRIAVFYIADSERETTQLMAAIPDDPMLAIKHAYVAIRAGNADVAAQRIARIQDRFGDDLSPDAARELILVQMMTAGIRGNYEGVAELYRQLQARGYTRAPYLTAAGYFLSQKAPSMERDAARFQAETEKLFEENATTMMFFADVAFTMFRDYEAFVSIYERYRAIPERRNAVGIPQRSQAIISYAKLKRWEDYDREFSEIDDSFMTPVTQRILPEVKEQLRALGEER